MFIDNLKYSKKRSTLAFFAKVDLLTSFYIAKSYT